MQILIRFFKNIIVSVITLSILFLLFSIVIFKFELKEYRLLSLFSLILSTIITSIITFNKEIKYNIINILPILLFITTIALLGKNIEWINLLTSYLSVIISGLVIFLIKNKNFSRNKSNNIRRKYEKICKRQSNQHKTANKR